MKYRHTIIVPYQDVDASRRLRLYSMENYLLNVAGKVADEMGISQSYISRLEKRILGRLHVEMMRTTS